MIISSKSKYLAIKKAQTKLELYTKEYSGHLTLTQKIIIDSILAIMNFLI